MQIEVQIRTQRWESQITNQSNEAIGATLPPTPGTGEIYHTHKFPHTIPTHNHLPTSSLSTLHNERHYLARYQHQTMLPSIKNEAATIPDQQPSGIGAQ